MSEDANNAFKPDTFFRMLEAFSVPGLDMKALMEGQRRNIEATREATQVLSIGATDVAKKQTEIVRSAVEQAVSFVSQMKVGDVSAMIPAQQEFVKQAFETGLNNARELAEMVSRSNQEAYQIVEQRVKENVEQLRKAATSNTIVTNEAN